jgi:hypothetical protein
MQTTQMRIPADCLLLAVFTLLRVTHRGKLMSAELACVSAGLGEGMGSRSSRPYSSPLEGAALVFVCVGGGDGSGRGQDTG